MLKVKFEIRRGAIHTTVLEQPWDFEEFTSSKGFKLKVCNSVELRDDCLFLIGDYPSVRSHSYYDSGDNEWLVELAEHAINEYNLRFGILPIED